MNAYDLKYSQVHRKVDIDKLFTKSTRTVGSLTVLALSYSIPIH